MITIDRIRKETGISDVTLLTDGLVQEFIDEETYLTEKEVGYSLQATPSTEVEITETHDGDGGTLLFLKSDSLVSVSEVLIGTTDITDDVKVYESGMIYYSSGFTKGVRNITVTFLQSSDINYAIRSIILWRVCVRAFQTYGAAMSEGASGEKFSNYSISFFHMPYNSVIQLYNQRIDKLLKSIGVSSIAIEIV